jgi:integrase
LGYLRRGASPESIENATDYLASVTASLARGDYVDPGASKATVDELGRAWLADQVHLKPSSLRAAEGTWRVHVQPKWGHRPVGGIRHSEVQAWLSAMTTAGKGATTVIRAHGVLAAILDVALKDRRMSANPARGVNLPRKTPKPRRYLTHSQVQLLAENAGDRGTLVLLLAYTGLRWGEATGLRLKHLDTLRRRLSVEENAVSVGGRIVVGTPKTHERRSVPYPPFLAEPLARECEGKTREQLLFGRGTTHLRSPDVRDGWFINAKKRAHSLDAAIPLDLTLHDLRHTAASLAISAGANVKAVQRMLGHASAAMTLDTYADLFDDDLDAVAGALESARAQKIVGDPWGAATRRGSKGR